VCITRLISIWGQCSNSSAHALPVFVHYRVLVHEGNVVTVEGRLNITQDFSGGCACMRYGSGMFGGWDYTGDAWPLYLLYFVLCVHDHKCQVDTIREQKVKLRSRSWSRHNQGAAAETDTISSVWSRETTAFQRRYRMRLLVHYSRGLHQTDADRVNEQDLWSICLQWWENCNANGGENLSHLRTVRAASTRHLCRRMRGQ